MAAVFRANAGCSSMKPDSFVPPASRAISSPFREVRVAAVDRADLRSRPRAALAVLTVALLALAAPSARAGQVRVDVGPSTDYSVRGVSVNKGDQVTWVWLAGALH